MRVVMARMAMVHCPYPGQGVHPFGPVQRRFSGGDYRFEDAP